LPLDDDGIMRARDAEAISNAEHVAVDGQAGHPKGMPQHHVGGLASDSRERDKRFAIGWHFAAVVGHKPTSHPCEGTRLRAEESGRLNLRR
jgi:hypothetical protein